MKEKTANIDILERLEFFEPDDLVECAMYRECIEGVRTLISENKELKEKYSRKLIDFQKEREEYEKDYIPKSKVEEKIEELSGMVEVGDITREMFNRIEYAIEVLLELLDERSNTDV